MTDRIYKDGDYLENNPHWHQEDSAWKARQIAGILAANDIQPSSVCEIGCGAGEILVQLSGRLGRDVHFSGFEISPQAFEICSAKAGGNLEFHLQDLLKQDSGEFDVVMAIDVFEHVDDYLGFLRKLRLRGSHHVFHIPLDLSVQTVLRGSPIAKARETVGHIHYFTRETALATLTECGYRILDHCYTHGSLELPNRGWKANLLKLPRKALFAIQQDWGVRILGGCSLLVLTDHG